MFQPIFLYSTLTKTKVQLMPLRSHEVSVYSCGPTVYSAPHIGNMRTFVFADTLRRVLCVGGYTPKHVINITDVGHLVSDADNGEDKIEKESKKMGVTAKDIVKKYSDMFFSDLQALNIPKNKFFAFPFATEYIEEQIQQIQLLEIKGLTYRIEDGIYFDTKKFKNYGALGDIAHIEIQAGARVEHVLGKKDVHDFALWKFSPKSSTQQRQQEWNSPWGVGFPGWHIECSAMAKSLLGETIDIHTGGIDLAPVHHNNEIAQSEGIFDTPQKKFVSIWMHSEHMLIQTKTQENSQAEKMSKSLGNIFTVSDLVEKGYDPLAIRYLFLQTHYQSQFSFTMASLDAAEKGLSRLREKIYNVTHWYTPIQAIFYKKPTVHMTTFNNFLFDNLSTPQAIACMHEWGNASLSLVEQYMLYKHADQALGLDLFKKEEIEIIPDEILELSIERNVAREKKNFEEADRLRKLIESKGYTVKDREKNTTVQKIFHK
ncbi:MAG: cysteine--tRNA ligase [Alphaproteobacteria bacterium]|nr:cysteine--tRNA ligase [Alphaproteobacteria bacterium]